MKKTLFLITHDPELIYKCCTHLMFIEHQDHMSAEYAAHVIQSGMTTVDDKGKEIPVPFIGPKKSVEL